MSKPLQVSMLTIKAPGLQLDRVLDKINQDLAAGGYKPLQISMLTIKAPYTYALLSDEDGILGEGFSKASPRDRWNACTGTRLAIGRAVSDYVDYFRRYAPTSMGMKGSGE